MNTRAKVLSVGGETEMFEITAGLLQGDTLAPFLPPLPNTTTDFQVPHMSFHCPPFSRYRCFVTSPESGGIGGEGGGVGDCIKARHWIKIQ